MAKYKQMSNGSIKDTERDLYIPETDPTLWGEYQTWLGQGNTADVFDPLTELPMDELPVREFRMGRIGEDLIDLLISKGVITMSELPQEAQDRLTEKKYLRTKL